MIINMKIHFSARRSGSGPRDTLFLQKAMRKILWTAALLAISSSTASAHRLPKTVVPSHYEIHLDPDLATGSLTGRETITVRLTEPTASIVLNAVDLDLRE